MVDTDVSLNVWSKCDNRFLAYQGESNSRVATVHITNLKSGKPVNLSGVLANIYFRKPDGTIVFSPGTVVNAVEGIVRFTLPQQATTAAGNVICQVVLTGANNSKLIVGNIIVDVMPSDLDGAIESTNEFSALTAALAKFSPWEHGTVTLTNSQSYPFNDSKTTVAFQTSKSGKYFVFAKPVDYSQNIGEIQITDELTNGFKIAYTGSAPTAQIEYTVTGELANG